MWEGEGGTAGKLNHLSSWLSPATTTATATATATAGTAAVAVGSLATDAYESIVRPSPKLA